MKKIAKAQPAQYTPSTDIISPYGSPIAPSNAGRMHTLAPEIITPELIGWGYDALVWIDPIMDPARVIGGHYLVTWKDA